MFLQYIFSMYKIITLTLLLFISFSMLANAAEDLDDQLVYRAAFGSAADANILLQQGANPNSKNSVDRPAIVIAASRDHPDSAKIVKYLVDNGANFKLADRQGENAFTAAVRWGTIETITYLLQLKPSYKMTNAYGESLYDLAKARRNSKVMAMLDELKVVEDEEWVALTSRKNHQKLMKDFSFKVCAEEYIVFYYSNDRMEDTDMDSYDNKITKVANEIISIGKDLYKYFGLTRNDLGKVEERGRKSISSQLTEMGSSGYRKRAGVGTDADLKRRCGRISLDIAMSSTLKRRAVKD